MTVPTATTTRVSVSADVLTAYIEAVAAIVAMLPEDDDDLDLGPLLAMLAAGEALRADIAGQR